ncbi:hypothetical protein PHET_12014 [Paragonimus heterotremus]|uniref:Uncharacterized protein n=1 Tax=Paragonimus heterotremus TaxID=100268 RepID=A0A8J4T0D9_9TREM|nr:hypothetical protein PHET_12014 [Paragonimus heterotremus]
MHVESECSGIDQLNILQEHQGSWFGITGFLYLDISRDYGQLMVIWPNVMQRIGEICWPPCALVPVR